MPVAVGFLLLAIAAEVGGTTLLPRADGFRAPFWTVLILALYGLSFWLLSVVVKTMPVSTAYAVWAGVGTAAIAVIGAVWLGEPWDWLKVAAVLMIVGGVVTLNLHGAH